ncbi:TIGR04086 family membrane protein [Alicyclobacillus cycloheptanicus]|uniref:Membrane protein (TIGR04086 family) n=1 Tax=Alicyclobacillus cycloheptanicus TaxID=1457 RepID=A0ABT9XF35_9BACL|nr:TIGR04086 family membrane protein [Alicyclobacillus cycloheptanicus]MDQ0188735.1 putative membrane protein (TIGR04086 family) [Alicyclobacillus cycloheptanicus]
MNGSIRSLRKFPILYGLAWSLFYAVIGILLVSLWAHVHPMSPKTLVMAAYIIHCAAVLLGAIAGSRAAQERGWYYGGMSGLFYAIVMICIGLFAYNTFSLDAGGLFRVLLMALIGAFGGIIGVNTGSTRSL